MCSDYLKLGVKSDLWKENTAFQKPQALKSCCYLQAEHTLKTLNSLFEKSEG